MKEFAHEGYPDFSMVCIEFSPAITEIAGG